MRHETTVTVPFEAAHRVESVSTCGVSNHGHAWSVGVTVRGGLDPKKVHLVDYGLLLGATRAVIAEFADRDLNDMLPGVVTTAEGVALYLRERLVLDYPNIVRIQVTMGPSISVTLESDPR